MKKKLIAQMMAVVMIITAILPGLSPLQVFANNPGGNTISIHQTAEMLTGESFLAPRINQLTGVPSGASVNQIYTSFEVPVGGRREFSFWMPTAGTANSAGLPEQIVLDVQRNGDFIDVIYNLSRLDTNGSPTVPNLVTGQPEIWGNTGLDWNFMTRDQFVINHPDQVINEGTYSTEEMIPDPNAPMIPDPNAPLVPDPDNPGEMMPDPNPPLIPNPNPPLIPNPAWNNNTTGVMIVEPDGTTEFEVPAFRIEGVDSFNNGFSFRFADREIHISFDAATGRVHFALNGLVPGYLMNFELTSLAGTAVNANQHMTTGVDTNRVEIIPFANGNRVLYNADPDVIGDLPTSWGELMPSYINRRYMDLWPDNRDNGDPTADPEIMGIWPGQPNTNNEGIDDGSGLILQLPVPRIADPTVQSASSGLVSLNILMESVLGQNAVTDIFRTPGYEGTGGSQAIEVNGDNYILVRAIDLEPSMLINDAAINYTTGGTSTQRPETIINIDRAPNNTIDEVYTLLEFRVERTALGYTIVIPEPYDATQGNPESPMRGFYRVMSAPYIPTLAIEEERIQRGQASEEASWSATPRTMIRQPMANRAYWVEFFRGTAAPGAGDEAQIISQDLVFTADPNAVHVGIPRHFTATGENARIPGNLEGDRGLFDLSIFWDIADFTDLARLMNNFGTQPATLDTADLPPLATEAGLLPAREFFIDYDLLWDYDWNLAESNDPSERVLTRIRALVTVLENPASPLPVLPNGDINLPDAWAVFEGLNFTIEYFLIDENGNLLGGTGYEQVEAGNNPRVAIPEDLRGENGARNPIFISSTARPIALNGALSLEIDTVRVGSISAGPTQRPLQFPYTYFLRIMPTRHSNEKEPLPPTGLSSVSSSITVDGFGNMSVAPPQNVQIDEDSIITTNTSAGDARDRVSFDMTFNIAEEAIRNFVNNSHSLRFPAPGFGGAPNPTDVQLEINIYLSNTEEALNNLHQFAPNDPEDEANQVIVYNERVEPDRPQLERDTTDLITHISVADHEFSDDMEMTFYLSDINDETGLRVGGREAREVLRTEDGVLALTGIQLNDTQWQAILDGSGVVGDITITIDGLDENWNYYVMTDIVVTQRGQYETEEIDEDTNTATGNLVWRPITAVNASVFSNTNAVVTSGLIQVPDPGLEYPPAPNLRIPQHGMDFAVLQWDRIPVRNNLDNNQTEDLEYEIIRVRAPQPASGFMNNRIDMTADGSPWGQLYPEHGPMHEGITAFRVNMNSVDSEDWFVRQWNGTSWVDPITAIGWSDIENLTTYSPTDGSGVITIRDEGLQANTVYFYYIRAVRTTRDEDGTAVTVRNSIWNNNTVTTGIAGAPIELRVEGDREFDHLNEVIISFVAPIANLEMLNPNQISLEYRIQQDEEPWGNPVRMNHSTLLQAGNNEPRTVVVDGENEPWFWFLYHIRDGISPGHLHNIQVRLVQITENGETAESMWSNLATWITTPDTDDWEDDRIISDWEDKIRDELNNLLDSNYFVMQNNRQGFRVIYRPSRVGETLNEARNAGSRVELTFSPAVQTHYYLPISVFDQIASNELAVSLVAEDISINMGHNVIDLNNNPAILSAGTAIRRNEIDDYMVRVGVNWSTTPNIHGEATLGNVADINLEVVAAEMNIGLWEDQVRNEMIERIDEIMAEGSRYIDFVEDEVRNGDKDAQVIQRGMLDLIEEVRQEFADIAADNFRDLRTRNPLNTGFDQAIRVSVNAGDDAAVTPYVWANGSWALSTATFNNNTGVIVPQPTAVAFTGRIIQIPGLTGAENSGITRAIVARHGLDDIFSGRAAIDVDAPATRGMLVDSVARIIGAPRGTLNGAAWLRERGINVSAGAATAPIPVQEALHLVMMVYANQTNTSIESIRITNNNLTNNLPGLSPTFARSFAAAIELGIYRNYNLVPNNTMTIGELLDVLTALDLLIGI